MSDEKKEEVEEPTAPVVDEPAPTEPPTEGDSSDPENPGKVG